MPDMEQMQEIKEKARLAARASSSDKTGGGSQV